MGDCSSKTYKENQSEPRLNKYTWIVGGEFSKNMEKWYSFLGICWKFIY